jgi:hypothetical protein
MVHANRWRGDIHNKKGDNMFRRSWVSWLGIFLTIACAGSIGAEEQMPHGEEAPGLDPAALFSEFAGFAGSQDNAAALVQGLREGSEVVLTGPGQQSVSFASRAGPLGYANVALALSVAQTNLALYNILEPDVHEVAAALAGGEILVAGETLNLPGVLNLRAQGMSWGQVAAELGFSLGDAVSIWAAEDKQARMAIAAKWRQRDVEIVDRSIVFQGDPRTVRPSRQRMSR